MFPADEPDPAKALATYGRALVAHVTGSDALTQARVVAFAAAKFPRLGQTFYEAGPEFGVRTLKGRLDAFVAAGTLAIGDTRLAATQFIDLCLGDVLKRLLFMVVTSLSEEEIGLTADSAVDMFMKAYGAPPRG